MGARARLQARRAAPGGAEPTTRRACAEADRLRAPSSRAPELVRHLRAAGAAGATALRGHWGYHGDHAPHGDLFWHLRRRVPVVTVVVDTPANVARWFEIVDELTQETGLVTSEMVSGGARAG